MRQYLLGSAITVLLVVAALLSTGVIGSNGPLWP